MPLNEPPSTPLDLDTISPRGRPPVRGRLPTAPQAHAIAGILREAAVPRWERARVITGMDDGNPPYNQARLNKRNEGWRANCSLLEGPSRIESAKAPFYDLETSTELYADCATEVDGPVVDATTATQVRSEEFDRMLRAWPSFDWNHWQMLDDFIKFGRGFFWWPRADSWHFKRLPWSKVLFPNGTGCDPEEWELFVVLHEWKVTRLYSWIADASAATAAGWDVDACYEAIRLAQPRDAVTSRDPLALQQALRDSDLYTAARSEDVLAASVYVKEFDGTWSRMVVSTPRQGVDDTQAATPRSRVEREGVADDATSRLSGNTAWLFHKRKVADTLWQLMTPYVYEVGDGSINALRGLGTRIVSVMAVKDRMHCETINNVFMRSAMTLQAPTGGAQAKAGLIQLGPLTVLPPGFVAQPSTIFGDIEGSLAVDASFNALLDTNTGTYRPQFEKPVGNPESATAANIRFTSSTVLSNSAVNRYYKQDDRKYEEIWRRVARRYPPDARDAGVQSARDFWDRCRARGLSDAQIADAGVVRAQRAIGNGSPVMRSQMTAELLPLATQTDLLGPRGRREVARMYVAARGGQHLVDRLFPSADAADVPTRDDYDAFGENADFAAGGSALLAAWQDHAIHTASHIQAGGAAVQATQQGASPERAYVFLQSAIPHIAQHIALVRDPRKASALQAAFKQLVQSAKQVEEAVAQQQKQQAQASSLTFDQQLAMQDQKHRQALSEEKAKGLLALKASRQQGESALNAQHAERTAALDTAKAAQAASLADATTAADIQRTTAETAASIAHERAKTQADIEHARAKTEADIAAKRAAAAAKPRGGDA